LLDYYLKINHSGARTGIPKSWAEFLLLWSCCNFDIRTLSERFGRQKSLPGRTVAERGEKQDIRGGGTDGGEVCSDEAPMDLFLSPSQDSRALSPSVEIQRGSSGH